MMRSFALFTLTITLSIGVANAAITSTFNSSAEGWQIGDIASATAVTTVGAATFNATGGNPGGYISTTDVTNIVAFVAPNLYNGNLSSYFGGSLGFQLIDTSPADANANYPAVVLYNGTQSIGYSAGALVPGTTSFTSFVIPLTASGWTVYPGNSTSGTTPLTNAQFQTFLTNVTNLTILADWHTGDDGTGLDNVVLAAAPEPSTWAALIVGFCGVGLGIYRRRRASVR